MTSYLPIAEPLVSKTLPCTLEENWAYAWSEIESAPKTTAIRNLFLNMVIYLQKLAT